jgi:iron complex transport system permease protein
VAALATVSLSFGDFAVPPADVVRTLLGAGSPLDHFVIVQVRLPRLLLAVTAGAALALSGALFQSLLHNPIASPDVVGITGGAAVSAVFAALFLGWSGAGVSGCAFVGAFAVAALIYALAWPGGAAGQQFVLVGVGIAFMVTGALGYLLTRADIQDAQTALAWLVGGVGSAQWSQVGVTAACLLVLSAATAATTADLRVLQLGDDTARGLGVPASRQRLVLLTLAVALAAVGTAAAGPLAFVAFVSAPIARRLVADGGPALVASALVGAVVVAAADFTGQHLMPGGAQVPAGVVTGAIGAPYLLWLLATSGRRVR